MWLLSVHDKIHEMNMGGIKRQTRVYWIFVIGFLFACVYWVGCRSNEKPKNLTILIWDSPVTNNPNQEFDSVTDSVLFNVFEPLVSLDSELKLQPGLAVSWQNPKPEIWRFHLRHDVRFHDGSSMDSEAVRAALWNVKNQEFETSGFLRPVEQIIARDPYTVDLITATPSALISKLPFVYVTKPNPVQGSPILGTGPFRVAHWEQNREITLKAFEDYWGKHPVFKEVRFQPVQDSEKRFEMIATGKADISYFSPSHLLHKTADRIRLLRHAGLAVYYLGFHLENEFFKDVRVRKAIHIAIDRKKIVNQVLGGFGSVPTQPVAPLIFGFDPRIPAPEHNIEEARRLIIEAGFPDGIRTRLDFSESRLEIAKLIRDDLKKIGIDVQLNALSRNDVYTIAEKGQSAFFLVGWDCSSGDASEFYEFNLHTTTEHFGQGNYGKYSNPEIDEICEKQSYVLNDTERKRMLQRAASIAMRDLPVIPVFIEDDLYALREHLHFEPRAEGQIKVIDITEKK